MRRGQCRASHHPGRLWARRVIERLVLVWRSGCGDRIGVLASIRAARSCAPGSGAEHAEGQRPQRQDDQGPPDRIAQVGPIPPPSPSRSSPRRCLYQRGASASQATITSSAPSTVAQAEAASPRAEGPAGHGGRHRPGQDHRRRGQQQVANDPRVQRRVALLQPRDQYEAVRHNQGPGDAKAPPVTVTRQPARRRRRQPQAAGQHHRRHRREGRRGGGRVAPSGSRYSARYQIVTPIHPAMPTSASPATPKPRPARPSGRDRATARVASPPNHPDETRHEHPSRGQRHAGHQRRRRGRRDRQRPADAHRRPAAAGREDSGTGAADREPPPRRGGPVPGPARPPWPPPSHAGRRAGSPPRLPAATPGRPGWRAGRRSPATRPATAARPRSSRACRTPPSRSPCRAEPGRSAGHGRRASGGPRARRRARPRRDRHPPAEASQAPGAVHVPSSRGRRPLPPAARAALAGAEGAAASSSASTRPGPVSR
jgi:hypothetical protein